MRAIYRHELSSHFTGLTAYVFGTFLLLFAGIFTMVYNIDGRLAQFEYALAEMALVFIIAIPVLTMRVISEEKKQKTDQLLYSLPITTTDVILGKYFALLTVLLLPTALIGLYPILLSAYGNVYLPAAFGALTGFFLLGAALLAMGMFLSSLTESQAMAAGICFVVMLLNYFITDLASYVGTAAFTSYAAFAVLLLSGAWAVYAMTKNRYITWAVCAATQAGLLLWYFLSEKAFRGAFPAFIEKLSLFSRFYSFANGVFDLRSVVYLVGICVLFVFLSVQSLQKRRWSE